MKKIFVALSLFFFIACQQHKKETVIEMGSNKAVEFTQSCQCDSLVKDKNDVLTLNGKIYTGTCDLYYPNSTDKYLTQQILEGVVNGSIFYYDRDGNVILEEEYVKGKKIGEKDEILSVNCKELLAKPNVEGEKIYYYNEKPFTGMCQDFYPESDQVYLVSNYKNGKLNGYTTYFNKDGSVLIMNKYEDNQVVSEYTTSMSEIEEENELDE